MAIEINGRLDLSQADLMNFRVEYVRLRSGRFLGHEAAERATKSQDFVRRVLNKQDEGLFRSLAYGVRVFLLNAVAK